MPRPCLSCCGDGPADCDTWVRVWVSCPDGPESVVTLTVTKDGIEVASGTPDSDGEWMTVLPGPGLYYVTASDPSGSQTRRFRGYCGNVAWISFEGNSCATCIWNGPDSINLSTPYGEVTMVKSAPLGGGGPMEAAYIGFGTIPSVENVSGINCDDYAVFCGCGQDRATRDLPILYQLVCFGPRLDFFAGPSSCQGVGPGGPYDPDGPPYFAVLLGAPPPNQPDMMGWGKRGQSRDHADLDGCMGCPGALEFVVDYGADGLPGSMSVVTVTGLNVS